MICPNCNYPESIEHIRGYRKCANCGVAFLPGQDEDKIRSYYQSGEYRRRFKQTDEIAHQRKRAEHIVKYIGHPNVFIDIGCSTGALLDLVDCRKYGVDIDPTLAKAAYRSLDEVPEKADCISLIHTLEHITHPLRALKNVYEKLNDGGRVVVEVPNGGGEKFYTTAYSFPHVVMFDKDSLEWTMRAAGFTVTDTVIHGLGGVKGALLWYYLIMVGYKLPSP